MERYRVAVSLKESTWERFFPDYCFCNLYIALLMTQTDLLALYDYLFQEVQALEPRNNQQDLMMVCWVLLLRIQNSRSRGSVLQVMAYLKSLLDHGQKEPSTLPDRVTVRTQLVALLQSPNANESFNHFDKCF